VGDECALANGQRSLPEPVSTGVRRREARKPPPYKKISQRDRSAAERGREARILQTV